MLECEGYKMFKGQATIVPINKYIPEFVEKGTFLYKPEHNCWYVNGHSYPAKIVERIRDEC